MENEATPDVPEISEASISEGSAEMGTGGPAVGRATVAGTQPAPRNAVGAGSSASTTYRVTNPERGSTPLPVRVPSLIPPAPPLSAPLSPLPESPPPEPIPE